MNDDPWSILGLNPGTASEKDVKVAYAKLIRQHRPDDDPEGFQRVRQAYDAALAQLKNPVPSLGHVLPVAAHTALERMEQTPTEIVSFPPPVMEAQLALKAAMDGGDSLKISEASAALQKRCQEARPGFLGMDLWNQALHQLFEGNLEALGKVVRFPQLLEELRIGQATVTHSVIGWWAGQEAWNALQDLADHIEQEKSGLGNEAAATVALRLGLLLSFRQPRQSRRLGHFAYPYLRLESRDAQVHQVEQQAALGECFMGFPVHQAEFWRKRFDDIDGDFDWESQEAKEARRYLVITRRRDWAGFGFIQRVVSEAWWDEFVDGMNRRAGGGSHVPSMTSSGGGSTFPRWAVVGIVFLVFRILAFFSNDTPSRRSTWLPSPRPIPTPAIPASQLPSGPAGSKSTESVPTLSDFKRQLESMNGVAPSYASAGPVREAAMKSCRAQLAQLKVRTPLVAAEVVRFRRGQVQQLSEAFSLSSHSTVGRSNAIGLASGLMWDEDTDNDIRQLAGSHLAMNLTADQLIAILSVTAHGTSSMKLATVECIEQFLAKRKADALPSELERLSEVLAAANDASQ